MVIWGKGSIWLILCKPLIALVVSMVLCVFLEVAHSHSSSKMILPVSVFVTKSETKLSSYDLYLVSIARRKDLQTNATTVRAGAWQAP